MKDRRVGEDYYDIGTFTGDANMNYFIEQYSRRMKEKKEDDYARINLKYNDYIKCKPR